MVLLATVVAAQQGGAKGAQPAGPRAIGSVKDIMNAIVDPAADFVWESVASHITLQGTVDKAPQNDMEWEDVRNHALTLAEAGNLLMLPGRAKDKGQWMRVSRGLSDAAEIAMKAADNRDVDALFAAGETIDNACEACHEVYWYPPTPKK
jgi:hypothetical protein